MKKVIVLVLLLISSVGFSTVNIEVSSGPDFWGGETGFFSMAYLHLPAKIVFKGLNDSFYLRPGIGVSGIYSDDISFMNYEFGIGFGYDWKVIPDFPMHLSPSLFLGGNVGHRYTDFRSEGKFGFSAIPAINLDFEVTPLFRVGPGCALKYQYHTDYYSLSVIASVNASIVFGGFKDNNVDLTVVEEEKDTLADSLQQIIDENNAAFTLDRGVDNEIKVNMSDILFESGSVELNEDLKEVVRVIAEELSKYDGIYILVEGYTDDIGDEEVNLQLSESRAKNVGDSFEEYGFDSSQIYYKGYGEENPLFSNDTEENRALNRRVELRIIWGN